MDSRRDRRRSVVLAFGVSLKKKDAGGTQRKEVSNWAEQWIRLPDPHMEDPVVWKALKRLAAADLLWLDKTYLYSEEDCLVAQGAR
jgi:hypothetical protein